MPRVQSGVAFFRPDRSVTPCLRVGRSVRGVGAAFSMAILAGGVGAEAVPLEGSIEAGRPGGFEVTHSRGGTVLSLGGEAFRTGQISDVRVLTFPSSPTIMTVWNERVPRDLGRAPVAHFAISRTGERIDQVMATENIVRLRYAQFDPLLGTPAIPEELRSRPDNELFLVQFVGTPLEEMREEIRAAGGIVERFLTDNTHIIRMTAPVRAHVEALPYVRWVGDFHPVYRLDEELLGAILLGGAREADVRVSIECLRRGAQHQQPIADFIAARGIVEHTAWDSLVMQGTVSLQDIIALAHRNDVTFIDPWGPPGTDMNIARQLGGAVPTLSNLGILGQRVRGEVVDSEIQMNHPQWNGETPLIHGPVLPAQAHGTSCYGIIFSTGVAGAMATGMMPQRGSDGQGVFGYYNIFGQTGMSRLQYNLQSVDPNGPYRVVFQTNSWGSTQTTAYNSTSALMDDAIFHTNFLVTQSQSNTGNRNSRPQAWAKNVVAVGGIQHQNTLTRNDDARSGASIGPAADGRVKPDLAHIYDSIYTTTNNSNYTNFGGTSGATPITAGHFGLFFQMWHEGVFEGWGGSATVFDSRPNYSLARAIAFATAYRYQWVNPPFSNWSGITRDIQGWGMIDVGKMHALRQKTFFVNGDRTVTNAQSVSFPIVVAAGEPELLISMAYNDPAGSPSAAQARINDLDLRVTAPGGAVYWGNAGLGAGNWSAPGGAPNTVDTVENVFVQNPQAGVWTVEVIGTQVVSDTVPGEPGVQANFGLAVFGGVAPPTCYANCDQSTTAPVLNIDDFTCFINQFAQGQSLPPAQQITHYANCDGSTTSPVLNVDDFTCFINSFALGCP